MDYQLLKKLASSGEVAAQIELVADGYTDPLQLKMLDDAEADRLSADQAFHLYKSLIQAHREGTDGLAWQLLCHSADGGLAQAQSEVADWHREFYLGRWIGFAGILPDDRIAYLWYSLAASQGRQEARMKREIMARGMLPSEVAEAERSIAAWRPGLCSDLAA